MGKLTKIKADGTIVVEETSKIGLQDLKNGVGGGWIETVPYFDSYKGEPCVAFCDEEGKLKGQAPNEVATMLWYEGIGQPVADFLVGDIIVVQGADLLENL